jgi:hypothetical protein
MFNRRSFVIVVISIVLMTAAGSNVAGFSFVDSVKDLFGWQSSTSSTIAPERSTPSTPGTIVPSSTPSLTDSRLTTAASSALDGFDPNANGAIRAVAVQSDGKILIGGNFTTVQDVPRNYLARLNTDGTLDTAFDPNPNSNVFAIALQADGKILVGGNFDQGSGMPTIGGATRNRIARLDRYCLGDRSAGGRQDSSGRAFRPK